MEEMKVVLLAGGLGTRNFGGIPFKAEAHD